MVVWYLMSMARGDVESMLGKSVNGKKLNSLSPAQKTRLAFKS